MKQFLRRPLSLFAIGLVSVAGLPLWSMSLPGVEARTSAGAAIPESDHGACGALAAISMPGVMITMAQATPAGFILPQEIGFPKVGELSPSVPICRIVGTIKPTPRSNIRFEIWLPQQGWNGKYNGVGNGGAAGFLAYQDMAAALARGYATGSTDTGHQAWLGDGSWMYDNPELVTDFARRSQHLTAVAAKALVKAFYGKVPTHAYFTGCSNGGGQGLMEALHYPGDYDGIVNGDAARFLTREWPGELYMSWVSQADGPGLVSKIAMLHQAVMDRCDPGDGLKDGLIEDPRTCSFDPSTLQCAANVDTAQCLTPPQVTLVRKIYAGLRDPHSGGQFWPGSAPGSELTWPGKIQPKSTPLPQSYMQAFVFHDRNWDYRDPAFSFESAKTFKALYAADARYGALLDADNPDLTAFRARGGKLVMYHGWADTDIAPANITTYYDRMIVSTGGSASATARARTADFARLFMVPGMAHCGGGEGTATFDALGALENWVEHGLAPARIEASHGGEGVARRTRPLCPYPQQAIYNGSGSLMDSRNYSCGTAKRGA